MVNSPINFLYKAASAVVALSLPMVMLPSAFASEININAATTGGSLNSNVTASVINVTSSNNAPITLQPGVTYRAVNGVDGGQINFTVPNNVLTILGELNANGAGGKGGQVNINAAYVFQNGNITANGTEGGVIAFNVGGVAFGPGSLTQATGSNGVGGRIVVNAAGTGNNIQVLQNATLDASGGPALVAANPNIELNGGVVNIDGIVQANGVTLADAAASNGGFIRVNARQNLHVGPNALVSANGGNGYTVDADSPANAVAQNGGNGGRIEFNSANTTTVAEGAKIQVNGGNGGTYTTTAIGELIPGTPGSPAVPGENVTGQLGTYENTVASVVITSAQSGTPITISGPQFSALNGSLNLGDYTVTATYNGTTSVQLVFKQGTTTLGTYNYTFSGNTTAQVAFTLDSNFVNSVGTQPVSANNKLLVKIRPNQQGTNIELDFTEVISSNTVIVSQTTGTAAVPATPSTQDSVGKDGGNGGNGGTVSFSYVSNFNNYGIIEGKGGNGGNGQNAFAEADLATATAGNGGNGGSGGSLFLQGTKMPTGLGTSTVDLSGGAAGLGGQATAISNWADTINTTGLDGIDRSETDGLINFTLIRKR